MEKRYNKDGSPRRLPRWMTNTGLTVLAGVTLFAVFLALSARY